jgi:multidrug efflux pump subunit AcrA (membrane-fusion protein)
LIASYLAIHGLLHLSVPDIDHLFSADVWHQHFIDLRQHGSLKFETAHTTRDGVQFPVEVVANYIKFGSTECDCAIVRNIAQRKQSEKELLDAKEFLEITQRSAGAGLWAWDFASGNLSLSSEQYQMFGIDPEVGTPTFDLWRSVVHPDDMEVAESNIKKIKQLEEEIKILTEVSEIRSDLAKEKLATRVQALDAQRSLNLSQAELLRYRRTALDELNISTNELAQAEEQLNKLKDRLDRVEVLAPVDGIVQDLKFRTVGGVVSPGGTLMNVVPDDGKLQAEVRASPTDIGFIRVGQTARLKVGTYDFMRYGTIDGEVTMVSPYSALDEKQNPYFKVIISMPKNYVGDDPSKKIDPGMTVMTDIMTDRQSVLRYLLRPIYIAFKQGMRER